MQLAKADLVAALRLRFDHYSATTMFDAARERAALADKPAYDVAEVAAFRTALESIADRLDRVNARIESLVADAPPPPPVAAPKPAPQAIETTIALSGVDVHEGDQVLICGGFAALGDWDPDRACRMSRKGDRWVATLALAPDVDVAFKFLRRAGDGTVVWESGDDRQLVAKPMIEAMWR
jgi:Starch binding domain